MVGKSTYTTDRASTHTAWQALTRLHVQSMSACRRSMSLDGHLAVAEALLESGAAFSQVCLNSALWHAAYHGHTACCELLLDHGADVHYNQDHSLCYAARHGHLQTAALLLDRGANAWSERAMQYATDTLVSRRGRGAAPAATRSLRPAASIACIHQQEGRGANEGSVLPSFWRLAQMRL